MQRRELPVGPICALLVWVALIQIISINFFFNGLFKSKVRIFYHSQCSDVHKLSQFDDESRPLGVPGACWSRPRYRRVMLIVIDALRFDFVVTHNDESEPYFPPPGFSPRALDAPLPHYKNKLTIFSELARREPDRARLFKFVADLPTVTTSRIEAIITSNFMTLMDAFCNFDARSITGDNLLVQLRQQGRRAVLFGDDTWIRLFPDAFDRVVPVESFNVRDTTSSERVVMENAFEELRAEDWGLFVGHAFGVDHIGHMLGADHEHMAQKLLELNAFFIELIDRLDEDTLLVVMGDHGMTEAGNHGSSSEEEMSAALFTYTKKKNSFSHIIDDESVSQMTLAPTLAILLGIPIPYSSLGLVIPDLLGGDDDQYSDALRSVRLSAAQIARYLAHSSRTDAHLAEKITRTVLDPYLEINAQYQRHSDLRRAADRTSRNSFNATQINKQFIRQYVSWNNNAIAMFRLLWSEPDLVKCLYGLVSLASALVTLISLGFHANPAPLLTQLSPHLCVNVLHTAGIWIWLRHHDENTIQLVIAASTCLPSLSLIFSLLRNNRLRRACVDATKPPELYRILPNTDDDDPPLTQSLSRTLSLSTPSSRHLHAYSLFLLITMSLSLVSQFTSSAIVRHHHVLHFALATLGFYFVWLDWVRHHRFFNKHFQLIILNFLANFSYLGFFGDYFDRFAGLRAYIYTDFAVWAYAAFQIWFLLNDQRSDAAALHTAQRGSDCSAPLSHPHRVSNNLFDSCQKIKNNVGCLYHVLNTLLAAVYWLAHRLRLLESTWAIRILVPRIVYANTLALVALQVGTAVLYRVGILNIFNIRVPLSVTHVTLALSSTALLLLGESSPAVLILLLCVLVYLQPDVAADKDAAAPAHPVIPLALRTLVVSLFSFKLYYVTGHAVDLATMHYMASFIGTDVFNYALCAVLLIYNTLCSFVLFPQWIFKLTRRSAPHEATSACIFLLTVSTIDFFSASVSAMYFRHHILYATFSMKWLLEVCRLMIVNGMLILGAISQP